MPKQPTKEYMRKWREKNKERLRHPRAKTRHDAKQVYGLPRVSTIGGLTLSDFIGDSTHKYL
jgi:hypothetical protein